MHHFPLGLIIAIVMGLSSAILPIVAASCLRKQGIAEAPQHLVR